MEKISVIVPVYNVEKYLSKCVDSIINQTYHNLEIILVDDGSPDRCGEICDEYATKDNRIKVIHKKNGGLSDARNAGIEVAEGGYIAFVDSDDYIASDMMDVLYHRLIKDGSDMALCNFKYIDEKGEEIEERKNKSPIKDEVITGIDGMKKLSQDKNWYYVIAWNKLYKKEIFDNIRFPKGKIHEDEFVIHHIMHACKRISCVALELYYYLQRQGSIMSQKSLISTMNTFEAKRDRALFSIEMGLNFNAYASVCAMAYTIAHFVPNDDMEKEKRCEMYHSYLKTARRLKTKGLDSKRKIFVIVTKIFPKIWLLLSKM